MSTRIPSCVQLLKFPSGTTCLPVHCFYHVQVELHVDSFLMSKYYNKNVPVHSRKDLLRILSDLLLSQYS